MLEHRNPSVARIAVYARHYVFDRGLITLECLSKSATAEDQAAGYIGTAIARSTDIYDRLHDRLYFFGRNDASAGIENAEDSHIASRSRVGTVAQVPMAYLRDILGISDPGTA